MTEPVVRPTCRRLNGRQGSAEGGVEAEGYLDVEGAGRGLPAVAEEGGDSVEALLDGVGVDVEGRGGAGRALAGGEVGVQGADEVGAALGVVVEDLAEYVLHVGVYVDLGRSDESCDAQVVRSR